MMPIRYLDTPIIKYLDEPNIAQSGIVDPMAPQQSDMLSALGHNLMKLPHGIAQGVENLGAAASGKLFPGTPFDKAVQGVVSSDNAALKQWEDSYQASTPNNAASYTGATVGSLAPWLYGGAANATVAAGKLASNAISKIPLLGGKITQAAGSGATQGAIMGAAAPSTGEDYWNDKLRQVKSGALLGALIPGAIQSIGSTYGSVKNALLPIISPKTSAGATFSKAAGDANISVPQELVPGSTPTTAQIAGTPEMVQLEKAYGNTVGGKAALAEREIQNNNARLIQLQKLAGTDADLVAAKAQRDKIAGPYIRSLSNPAESAPVNASPIMEKLNALEDSSFGTDPVIRRTIADLRSQLSSAVGKTDVSAHNMNPEQFAKLDKLGNNVRPDLLDGIRQNLRNIIADNSTNGIVRSKQEAGLAPVAGSIVDAIDAANPGYRSYLAAYGQHSEPIRTMEASRSILEGLTGGRDSSGNPILSLSNYNGLLKRALSGDYPVSKEAKTALENIQSDLQRASISNSIRQPGSDTLYNASANGILAKLMYGNGFTGGVVPKVAGAVAGGAVGGLLGHPLLGIGVGSTAASKAAGIAGDRYSKALGGLLMNPEEAMMASTPKMTDGEFYKSLMNVPLISALNYDH